MMEVFRLKKYDLDDVKRLIDLANKNDLGVLEIETKKGRRIRIERNKQTSPAVTFTANTPQESVSAPVPAPVATTTVATTPADPAPQESSAGKTIDAPMVGVFYIAPSPDAEPFVKVGQSVKKGDTVCIIEAMKLMNEIQAEEDGVITEVLAKNGEIIEFGQPLFAIK
ncbi:MAG: acetyl-CoA carboxylase biotin carboxyl carrier protein [Oscillospiraceae bacterium]|nr:acetyl-CoA carboxylase biotin carboxyl carrier protein [Oscillospiraceae bacterium]